MAGASLADTTLSARSYKSWLRSKWFVIGTAIFIACGGTGVGLFLHMHRTTPLDGIANRVSFPLYYPAKMPSGYHFNASTLNSSSELVSYSLDNASQAPVTMTLQSPPKDFDAKRLIGESSVPILTVPIGTLYDISTAQSSKYFLTTGNGTLIFINSGGKLSSALVNNLAASLRIVK